MSDPGQCVFMEISNKDIYDKLCNLDDSIQAVVRDHKVLCSEHATTRKIVFVGFIPLVLSLIVLVLQAVT